MAQRAKLHYKIFDNEQDFVDFQNNMDVQIHQITPIGHDLQIQSDDTESTITNANFNYYVFVIYHLTSENFDDKVIPLLFEGTQKVVNERFRLQDSCNLQPARTVNQIEQLREVGLKLINNDIESTPRFFERNDTQWVSFKSCTKEQRHRIGLAFLLAEYDTIDYAIRVPESAEPTKNS